MGDRAAGSLHLRGVGERGLPHWVTGRLGARARTGDAEFMAAVERWFGVLLPQIVERQVDRGGPVLMVQVENEYGSYGSDHRYLRALADLLVGLGVTVPLFTSDGPEDHMLTGVRFLGSWRRRTSAPARVRPSSRYVGTRPQAR